MSKFRWYRWQNADKKNSGTQEHNTHENIIQIRIPLLSSAQRFFHSVSVKLSSQRQPQQLLSKQHGRHRQKKSNDFRSNFSCSSNAPNEKYQIQWTGQTSKKKIAKKLFTLLDLCVSSLRRGHANLLCIVPILTDALRRGSKSSTRDWVTPWHILAQAIGFSKSLVCISRNALKFKNIPRLESNQPWKAHNGFQKCCPRQNVVKNNYAGCQKFLQPNRTPMIDNYTNGLKTILHATREHNCL